MCMVGSSSEQSKQRLTNHYTSINGEKIFDQFLEIFVELKSNLAYPIPKNHVNFGILFQKIA